MNIIDIVNPAAMLLPDVIGLLKRGIESDVLLAPHGFDTLAPSILGFVNSDDHYILLGSEKGEWKAFAMGYFNTDPLFPYPTIVMFYNEGSRKLRNALKRKLRDKIASRGYTRALAVNGAGQDHAVWKRALTPEGYTARDLGMLVMFEED